MSVRKIGAFAGGVAQGFSGGKGGLAAGAAIQQNEEATKYYQGLADIMEDFKQGRGAFARDGSGQEAPAPVKLAPASASVRPDAFGPPESFGGGSADALARRSLDNTQQPATPLATSMSQPAAPTAPLSAQRRRLPFADFIGA